MFKSFHVQTCSNRLVQLIKKDVENSETILFEYPVKKPIQINGTKYVRKIKNKASKSNFTNVNIESNVELA